MTAFIRRNFHLASGDGLDIGVREVKTAEPPAVERVPAILVHGACEPGRALFDLPVPGASLAEDLALLGHTAFIPDARGFGCSARPAAMERPAAQSRPLVRSLEVVRDIDATVKEALQATGRKSAALLGWGAGGLPALTYAGLWPERVSHLVLFNPLYGGANRHPSLGRGSQWEDPARAGAFDHAGQGGYRFETPDAIRREWDGQIPIDDKDDWRDPAVIEALEGAFLDSDPTASDRDPPSCRVPNGMMEDAFMMALGHRLVDATNIYCRVMIVRPEYDHWSRPEDVAQLQDDLVHAKDVRVLELRNTTHYVLLDRPERGRKLVLSELAAFLSE